MNKLKKIEELLLIAVRALSDIPQIMKDGTSLNKDDTQNVIGSNIFELMEIREKIYQLAIAI